MEVVPIESLISSVEAFVYHIKIRHFVFFSENKLSRAPDGCGLTEEKCSAHPQKIQNGVQLQGCV